MLNLLVIFMWLVLLNIWMECVQGIANSVTEHTSLEALLV